MLIEDDADSLIVSHRDLVSLSEVAVRGGEGEDSCVGILWNINTHSVSGGHSESTIDQAIILVSDRHTGDEIKVCSNHRQLPDAGDRLFAADPSRDRFYKLDRFCVGFLSGTEGDSHASVLGLSRDSGDDVFAIEIPLCLSAGELNLGDKVKV